MAERASPSAVPVAIVGNGARAEAWRELAARSPRVRLVRERVDDIDAALALPPEVRIAAALPPRAGLHAALALARVNRVGLVQAPLHWAASDTPGARNSDVRVAHGWVTLRRAWFESVIARVPQRVEITCAGLPEAPDGDLDEVATHALALWRRLFPRAVLREARTAPGDGLDLLFDDDRVPTLELRIRTSGRRVLARAEGDGYSAIWSWQDDVERWELQGPGGTSREAPCVPGAARALAQLVVDDGAGDRLEDALAVGALMRQAFALAPELAYLGQRPFRSSLRRAERHPELALAPLGLAGHVPEGALVSSRAAPRLDEPCELWGFRAGDKPVVFLTLEPDRVDATLALFPGAHVERRERRVQRDALDTWKDRRDVGDARVELYVSRDPDLAARAARLQADADPSRGLTALAELLGYPPCCARAFESQSDRSNNSRNRYATLARTLGRPGAWQLNNLFITLIPFFPCRYDCPVAIEHADRAIAELTRAHPTLGAVLRGALSGAFLYFAHDRVLALDGERAAGRIAYRAVAMVGAGSDALRLLGSALGGGDSLDLDSERLVVRAAGREHCVLARTDPALGVVADFAAI